MGVAVLDRVTGEIAVGAQGTTPVAWASLTKLYTVVDVLDRATAGEITLTDDDLRGIERALSLSDDDAMNALWSRFGGAATVDGAVAAAGMQDSRRPSDPSQWGEAMVSVAGTVGPDERYVVATNSTSPSSQVSRATIDRAAAAAVAALP